MRLRSGGKLGGLEDTLPSEGCRGVCARVSAPNVKRNPLGHDLHQKVLRFCTVLLLYPVCGRSGTSPETRTTVNMTYLAEVAKQVLTRVILLRDSWLS